MKKFLLLVVCLTLAGAGCVTSANPVNQKQTPTGDLSSAFNFTFKYGVGAKNELDTFRQSFTKDMIVDPSVTIPLELTADEMAGVEKKINDLKIFEQKPEQTNTFETPCTSYDLLVQNNGIEQHLVWNCEQNGGNDAFQELTDYIRSIVESRDSYKALPEPKGGYS